MRTILSLALTNLLGVYAFGALVIPGDAQRGERLFTSQGCVQCHSINGKGGKIGPDLGKRVGRSYTPSLLASLMWNHAPAMWGAMAKQGVKRPEITTEQAADLFAYFYAARYFEEPGDAGRGKQVFESKGCSSCHGLSTAKPEGFGAKPVSQWISLNDPILLAQAMWNHSSQMKAATAKKRIEWPRLTSQELTDLLVYLQNLPGNRGKQAEFTAASAETGKMLFELKGCAKCHAGKLSLENRFTNRSLTDFAVAMWNHSPKMAQPVPELRAEEMRRIVGYLWSLQLFDQPGNAERGKKVFTQNKCAVCHDDPSSGAPRLTGDLNLNSLAMVSVLWQHGPSMLQKMQQKKVHWPRFTGSEMADLLAYLDSRQPKQ